MGNSQSNEGNDNLDNEHNLINNEDNINENQNIENDEEIQIIENFDTLEIKEFNFNEQIYHVKNPVLLLKETLILEPDQTSNKKYYIKFKYDALLNFDCHISFLVKENKEKEILPKMINVSAEKYKLSYISCSPTCEQIIIKNIPKGENMDFSYKEAFINLDKFNSIDIGENKKQFDVSIELVPILKKDTEDYTDKNEIVFVNLCNLFVHNGHYEIKTMKQEFKSLGLWFNLFDVFDSSNNGLCLICYNKKCNTIITPCNHSFACVLCANHIKNNEKKCPICKNDVSDIIIININ
jgi:hypothetical protein